ncbi:MAG TPA: IscS subfamily cysteine desulfurase [Terriglobales bacterium]|nr:IscS subfamily cysteine desulfurase [Terriglobales bacterium]
MKLPIYLDNHATTEVDPRVLEAMLPYFSEKFGNAASRSHQFGWEAEQAVETAREQVAKLVGASAKEIIFTSGATESDNLAIKGIAEACGDRGDHIITAATEHKAVLDSCKHLEKQGYRVTYLSVASDGLLSLEELKAAFTDKTILVTIMYANNEVGVLQPIAEISRLCHQRGVPFHCDAVQAIGKVPVDVNRDGIDMMSITAHKLYGPKGAGALYVRGKSPYVRAAAQIDGGGHEHGMRSGTLNVPGIVGLGKACELARQEMPHESRRIAALRDKLRYQLEENLNDVHVNGSMEHRLPGNLNIRFGGVDSESLLMGINDIAVSTGAACTAAKIEPSYVLKAMGLTDEEANSTLRFGIGRFNTEAEIDYAAGRVIETVKKLRELSSFGMERAVGQ